MNVPVAITLEKRSLGRKKRDETRPKKEKGKSWRNHGGIVEGWKNAIWNKRDAGGG